MVKGEESTEPKYSGKDSEMSFEKLDEKMQSSQRGFALRNGKSIAVKGKERNRFAI